MTIGDRVRLNATGIKLYSGSPATRVGLVVGRSRHSSPGHPYLWVMWDRLQSRQPYAVECLELAE